MKFVFTLGIALLLSNVSWASHPQVVHQEIGGANYTCRPVESAQDCLPDDTLNKIMADLEVHKCTSTLQPGANVEDIKSCFLAPSLKKQFDLIQLLDLPLRCLKKPLVDCMEAKPDNCLDNCGFLGDFLNSLKKKGLNQSFTLKDGQEACRSLIY